MKNPGCLNNRGSPLSTSGNPSYQILRSPNAPAAMTLKAKTAYGDDIDPPSHRPVFKKLRFSVRADTKSDSLVLIAAAVNEQGFRLRLRPASDVFFLLLTFQIV